MIRLLIAAFAVAACTAAFAQDKPKGEKLDPTTFGGHFERNNSGLTGDASFLLFPDLAAFEKVFGTVPPAGLGKNPGSKAVNVSKATFDTSVVATIIKRGNSPVSYIDATATLEGDTVTVAYKSQPGQPTSARLASPLILAFPKDKVKKVVFVENGREIGTAK